MALFQRPAIVAILIAIPVFAEPQIELSIDPMRVELHSGEPAWLHLNIRNKPEGESNAGLYTISMTSQVGFALDWTDDDGNTVNKEKEESWYPDGHGFQFITELSQGEAFTKTIVVHQFLSTNIKEGRYFLRVNIASLRLREGGLRSKQGAWRDMPGLPKTFDIPVVIIDRDDVAVQEAFKNLFARAVSNGNHGNDIKGRRMAFDSIVYARGSLALPFQIALVRETYTSDIKLNWGDNRFLEMFRCIAHEGDAEAARRLIDFAMEPQFSRIRSGESRDSIGAWQFLDYAIRELHSTGKSEIVAHTKEYVDTIPPSEPIIPGYFMNASSIENDDY